MVVVFKRGRSVQREDETEGTAGGSGGDQTRGGACTRHTRTNMDERKGERQG